MNPFISFRSETASGAITLTFRYDSPASKKLLSKLAAIGAMDEDTVNILKRKGKID